MQKNEKAGFMILIPPKGDTRQKALNATN